jgi:hypothetical protein
VDCHCDWRLQPLLPPRGHRPWPLRGDYRLVHPQNWTSRYRRSQRLNHQRHAQQRRRRHRTASGRYVGDQPSRRGAGLRKTDHWPVLHRQRARPRRARRAAPRERHRLRQRLAVAQRVQHRPRCHTHRRRVDCVRRGERRTPHHRRHAPHQHADRRVVVGVVGQRRRVRDLRRQQPGGRPCPTSSWPTSSRATTPPAT